MDKTLKLVAYEYGKLAFEKGRPAVPAADNDFLNNILSGLKVGEGLQYIKAWTKGWHDANLKVKID